MFDLVKILSRSVPTDVIQLTHASDKALTDLWSVPQQKSTGNEAVWIPSDLFHVDTIPLLDCRIIVDETGDREDGEVVDFRVKILPDYHDLLVNSNEGEDVTVGAIQLYAPGGHLTIPLFTRLGKESLGIGGKGWVTKDGITVESVAAAMQMSYLAWLCMTTWYGVQIALLHPTVRDVFNNPALSVMTTDSYKLNKFKKHHKPTPVKYVKKHNINSIILENLLYGNSTSKSYQRKALIWYVIGHWRTYKDGKRVFVQPHWKGALKNNALAKTREREIIFN
jgi:hypothetical protein